MLFNPALRIAETVSPPLHIPPHLTNTNPFNTPATNQNGVMTTSTVLPWFETLG